MTGGGSSGPQLSLAFFAGLYVVGCWDGIPIEMRWEWDGIRWDGNLFSVPPPVTIPSPSPNFLIPAPIHTISRKCSHPTQHTMINLLTPSQYHPNTIPIPSHPYHICPITYQHNSRNLLTDVHNLRKILRQDVQKRGLGRPWALDDVEKICLLLDPRFKSLCTDVCFNEGNDFHNEVCALVEYKFKF